MSEQECVRYWKPVGGVLRLDGRRRAATAAVAASILLLGALWPDDARVRVVGTSAAQEQAAQKQTAERKAKAPPNDLRPASCSDDASAADRQVAAALESNIGFQFVDAPLVDAVKQLRDKAGVDIYLDINAFEAAGVGLDTPITLDQSVVRFRSALNRLTQYVGMTWYAEDGGVVVTSKENAENELRTRVYDVRDLLQDAAAGDAAWESLLPLVKRHARPERTHVWVEDGRDGAAVTLHDGLLVVCQTHKAHEQIAGLLRALRQLRAVQGKNQDERDASFRSLAVQVESEEERAIAARLPGVCQSVQFLDVSLADVAQFVSSRERMSVVLDVEALNSNGIASNEPVTFVTRGELPLQAMLARLLRPLKLVAVVRDDALTITSQELADSLLVTRLYPLHDMTPDVGPPAASELLRLAELIQATTGVPKPNWSDNGGVGVVDVIPASRALAVSTTIEVHAQIETLFANIRRLRKMGPDGGRPAPNSATPAGSATVRVFWIVASGKQAAPANSADDIAVAVRELLVGEMGDTIEPFQITTLKDRLFVRAGAAVHERVARMATEELTGLLSVEAP